jgi:hypothetical protein
MPRLPQQRSMSRQSVVLGRVFPVDSTTITLPRIFHSLVSAVRHPQLSGDTARTACTGLVSVTCSFARSPWVHYAWSACPTHQRMASLAACSNCPHSTSAVFHSALVRADQPSSCAPLCDVSVTALYDVSAPTSTATPWLLYRRLSVARNLRRPAHFNCLCTREGGHM